MWRSTLCVYQSRAVNHMRNPNNHVIVVASCKRRQPGRFLQTSRVRKVDIEPRRPSSRVEASVLSYKQETSETASSTCIAVKKPSLAKRIINECVHYYHGFRLLFINVGISGNLLVRVLQGETLSRREKKQLVTTTSDVFRLVPFSVFIIVPFMELTLPIFLKLFPNMLPSTFQTADEREAKFKTTLKVKLEMAKFLQQTLDEMAPTGSGHESRTAQEFAEFFQKIRSSGLQASNKDILRFCKLFEDEITLDSLSRPQLTALCRVLEIAPIGTNNLLRFQLRMRLRRLVADDKLILKEGIDSLSIGELQAACRARGMRSLGVSEIRLKSQLRQWLDLSMDSKVPPSLLLLSRALYLPENVSTTEQLQATIASLPESVAAQTTDSISQRRGKINNQARIEALRVEQAKINEERKESFRHLADGRLVLDNKTLSLADAALLENALESVGVQRNKRLLVAKEDLTDLKEEMADYQEDIKEMESLNQTAERNRLVLRESKAARRLFQSVNRMIHKLEHTVVRMDKSVALTNGTVKDEDEIVSIEEIIASINRIQAAKEDSAKLQKIVQILHHIDQDRDGVVRVDEVMKVIELLEAEGIQLTAKQMTELLGVVDKEEILQVENKIEKSLGHYMKIAKPDDIISPISPLQAKPTKRICVEEVLAYNLEASTINRQEAELMRQVQEKPLDVSQVDKILSLVKAKHPTKKNLETVDSSVEPLFFRARTKSTGATTRIVP